ncbi:hypothetical protein CHISP_3506 [Chitinispirillum alkaliphilum]|nr:hypothetical protein CHISP_3506 [Chitinispirillum alkaliphilum]
MKAKVHLRCFFLILCILCNFGYTIADLAHNGYCEVSDTDTIVIEPDITLNFGPHEKDFYKMWGELEENTLPLEYSSDIKSSLPGIKKITEPLLSMFKTGYNYPSIAKLPQKENIKLFLLEASDDVGETVVFLGSCRFPYYLLS